MQKQNTEHIKTANAVLDRLKDAAELPTLPHIATTLLQMVYSEDCNIREIGGIIERDPALSANVLKMVNSPLCGVRQRIYDIPKALVLLGIREIVNLVSGLMVFKTFGSGGRDSSFPRKDFWLHSAACAVISRTIAKEADAKLNGEEFIAGLLHDVGKILLDQHFHDEFTSALQLAEDKQISLHEAEKQVLGISHAQIGSWIAMKWRLPQSISDAIANHHEPGNCMTPLLAAVVYNANLLCKVCGIGYSGYSHGFCISDETGWRILQEHCPKLANTNVDHFVKEVDEEVEKARDFLRISSGG